MCGQEPAVASPARTVWHILGTTILASLALAVLLSRQPEQITLASRRSLIHYSGGHRYRELRAQGFYVPPEKGDFYAQAKQANTSKIIIDATYHSLFEPAGGRRRVHKMFEIGLGCNEASGPGASATLWRTYMPRMTEIWFAEYDAACAKQYKGRLDELRVRAVTGDQADPRTLYSWINETGGNFDFITDDGGHGNDQMYNSFIVLFQHALRPGGVYVIEDLCAARIAKFQGGPWNTKVVMIDAIKDWIEALLTSHFQSMVQKPELAYQIKHKMPPGIKSVTCAYCACMVVKCYADDMECDYKDMVDHALAKYGQAQS